MEDFLDACTWQLSTFGNWLADHPWAWVREDWTLGGILGLLGFLIASSNWWWQRPDVFLVVNFARFVNTADGRLRPEAVVVEVHNAGSMGITMSAISVEPAPLVTGGFAARADRTALYVKAGPRLPARLEARDSKVWQVDLQSIRQENANESLKWVVVVGRYGRRPFLRKFRQQEGVQRRRFKKVDLQLPERIVRALPEGFFDAPEGTPLPSDWRQLG